MFAELSNIALLIRTFIVGNNIKDCKATLTLTVDELNQFAALRYMIENELLEHWAGGDLSKPHRDGRGFVDYQIGAITVRVMCAKLMMTTRGPVAADEINFVRDLPKEYPIG